jgi:hypothetical protein
MTDTDRRLAIDLILCAVLGTGTVVIITQLAPIVLVLVGQWARGG